MIAKLVKCAAVFMTVAVAKELVEHEEFQQYEAPQVQKGNGLDWFLFSLGLITGLGIETGTNIGGIPITALQCYGQSSDLIESLYFTYLYIWLYVKDRTNIEYITYVSVYIARGVNSVQEGPCWWIGMKRNPSETEI